MRAIFTFAFSISFLTACQTKVVPPPLLEARQEIGAGNDRFVAGHAAHPRQEPAHRAELESGQKPHTIVFSCSDSRVPPELVLDQGLGDLFVIRTAGEVADSAAIASIEYAIEHLGVRQLLVMGHERCGAVTAALETPPGESTGSEHIDHLVRAIRPNVAHFEGTKDPTLDGAVRAQVDGVAAELAERSHVVARMLAEEKLRIVKGIYRLESGRVDTW